jgi:hypothetical protein
MAEKIVSESEDTIREVTVTELEAVAGSGSTIGFPAPRPPMLPGCPCPPAG